MSALYLSGGGLAFPSVPDGPTAGSSATTEQRADISSSLASQLSAGKAVFSRREPVRLTWTLTNVAAREVLVISHYAVGNRRHFDPLELRIVRREDRKVWTLALTGPRKAAAKIACLLAPGRTLRHDIDVAEWSSLQRVDLGMGTFEVVAVYRVAATERPVREWANCDEVPPDGSAVPRMETGPPRDPWRGVLESSPAALEIRN